MQAPGPPCPPRPLDAAIRAPKNAGDVGPLYVEGASEGPLSVGWMAVTTCANRAVRWASQRTWVGGIDPSVDARAAVQATVGVAAEDLDPRPYEGGPHDHAAPVRAACVSGGLLTGERQRPSTRAAACL